MEAQASVVETSLSRARERTARRVFHGCVLYTAALTAVWLYLVLRGDSSFGSYSLDVETIARVGIGLAVFTILWGWIWYRIKSMLLRRFVGFSDLERREAFGSRMRGHYDLPALLARHSERRIRIVDMIGRRGRFILLQSAGFYYLYARILDEPSPRFLTLALQDNLFDAIAFSWVALALYRSDGFLGRMFYGAQSRVMDGSLARANCLLIGTLWSGFKLVMVPIGVRLEALFPPSSFAALFVLIWGAYVAADATSEVVGSLFGEQKLRVWGIGEVNRKSWAGTLGGFGASLTLCVATVLANGLPPPWLGLAVVVSVSSTLVELLSPRGTDDFTMATTNALICWAFGALL